MSLEQAALLAEIIGGLAVLLTLIYLVIEVRRNTAAMRSATHQTQVDSQVNVNNSVANDAVVAALIAKANDDFDSLNPGEQIQLQYLYVNYFNMWHSGFWSTKNKFLSEQAWPIWDKGMTVMLKNQAACRAAWLSIAPIYDDEFRSHVDGIIESIGPVTSDATGVLRSETRNDVA